ncbi:hypothetical protein AC53_5130 [Escherichia coli 7-233-03_S3_C3]|nr:hypothetical protein AC53_5130 [Escherichia coli 7-233-03_S3_C3]
MYLLNPLPGCPEIVLFILPTAGGIICSGVTGVLFSWAERKIFYRVLGEKFCGLFIYPGQVRQVVAVYAPGDRGLNR